MALTRAQIESVIVGGRARRPVVMAEFSTLTDGTNPDANDWIARALETLGVPPADRASVTDADLTRIGLAGESRLLDLIEINAIEACFGQLVLMPRSITMPDYAKSYGDFIQGLEWLLVRLRDQYLARYARSGAPAIGAMEPQLGYAFDPSRYRWPFVRP